MRAILRLGGLLAMRSLVGRVLVVQLGIAALGAVLALVWGGAPMVKAALVAGFIAAVPALAYSRVVAWMQMLVPRSVLLAHALGELLKLALTVVLLALAFVFLQYKISIPYFFGVYVLCLMSYGVALIFK